MSTSWICCFRATSRVYKRAPERSAAIFFRCISAFVCSSNVYPWPVKRSVSIWMSGRTIVKRLSLSLIWASMGQMAFSKRTIGRYLGHCGGLFAQGQGALCGVFSLDAVARNALERAVLRGFGKGMLTTTACHPAAGAYLGKVGFIPSTSACTSK